MLLAGRTLPFAFALTFLVGGYGSGGGGGGDNGDGDSGGEDEEVKIDNAAG
jgi:hypothetical protein